MEITDILTILIPGIIEEIISNDNVSESEAIMSFYNSELYSVLEDDETKLWHLSAKALYELYKQEKTTGIIEYPREQS